MPTLYSCRTAGEAFRITKFDDGLNVESSYTTDGKTCDCPAGPRPMCRHREMLPRFQHRGAVDTGWMFDYDRGGWVDMRTEDEIVEPQPLHGTGSESEFADSLVIEPTQDSSGVEQGTHKPEAAGSNPAPATNAKRPNWRRF